jgi:uncharacterized protein (TIGR00369 family)
VSASGSSPAPALSQEQVRAVIDAIPFARFLDVRIELKGDELTVVLPFRDEIIGNPVLPAIHGGVIGALMEVTAVAQISVSMRQPHLPKTIDVVIDYLRSGRPADVYARAHVTKLGRRIANVRVEAWQFERDAPIASLHGHFLLPKEASEKTV